MNSCSCGFCVEPTIFLSVTHANDGSICFKGDGGFAYPCRIRTVIDDIAIVAVLTTHPSKPVIRFADGAVVRSFSDATKYAHQLVGKVRKQGVWELSLWALHIAHVGFVTLDRLNQSLFFGSGKNVLCSMQCQNVRAPVNAYHTNKLIVGKMRSLFESKWQPKLQTSERKRKRHKQKDLAPDDDLEEEEEAVSDWSIRSPKETWTAPLFHEYVCANPSKAPILRKITHVYRPVGPGNPRVQATFAHPQTNEDISLLLSSVTLHFVTQYRATLLEALQSG